MKSKPQTTKTKSVMAASAAGSKGILPSDYPHLLKDIKARIRAAQIKATFSANREMILMYWDIGRMIAARQKKEGWGAAVIPRLANDIRNEMPEVKGFSERNIGRMIAFYREYSAAGLILPQPVAKLASTAKKPQIAAQITSREILPQVVAKNESYLPILQQVVAKLPWGHHVTLMEKIKDLSTRYWYMLIAVEQGWSRNILNLMIDSRAHERQGRD